MTLTRDTHDAAKARHPDVGTESTNPHLGIALAIICAAELMVVLDATVVNVALPSIQRQLHFSSVNLEWVITGYALAFGGLLLLGGRIGDLFGRRRMFITGVLLFTTASFLGGLAPDQGWLIGAASAGNRWRHRRPDRAGTDRQHVPRRALAEPCDGRLRGDVRRWGLTRPPPRRHLDRHRLVALGALRKRADRPVGGRGGTALHR